jgi:hypothetical protein
VPDECDIASGTSEDLDNDQVPDECDGPPAWRESLDRMRSVGVEGPQGGSVDCWRERG